MEASNDKVDVKDVHFQCFPLLRLLVVVDTEWTKCCRVDPRHVLLDIWCIDAVDNCT